MQMDVAASLVFEVPGDPRGKGRHRSGKTRSGKTIHYADPATESYEAQIKWFARQAMGAAGVRDLLQGPLWMHVTSFHMPSQLQARAIEREPQAAHYCTVKPDADNLAKIFCDALNGVVYRDDATVADVRVVKRLGTPPRVVVSIGRLQ